MKKMMHLSLLFLLVLGTGVSAASFDSALLVDTYWVVQAKGKSTFTSTDGKEAGVIYDGATLEFGDTTFTMTDSDDEIIVAGTWTVDSKGKITLTADADSLETYLLKELEADTITSSSCSIKGTVKQKGDTLTIQLTLAISGSGTGSNGSAQLAIAVKMNGSTIPGDPQVTPATYLFPEVHYTDKLKNLTNVATVAMTVDFTPLSDYGGTFTLVGEAEGTTVVDLEGLYTVIGQKTLLFPNINQLELLCEDIMNSLFDANPEEVEDVIDWWVEGDNAAVITFQEKGDLATLSGKITYLGAAYLDNDKEVTAKGTTSFNGTGTFQP